MGDAVGHASTAFGVFIAAFVEVADDAPLGFAALGFRIETRNVAEGMLGIVSQSVLVMKNRIMAANIFQATELLYIAAARRWFHHFINIDRQRLRQMMPRVNVLLRLFIRVQAFAEKFMVCVTTKAFFPTFEKKVLLPFLPVVAPVGGLLE